MKRVVAGVFVSALTVVGVAPAASALSSSPAGDEREVSTTVGAATTSAKAAKIRVAKIIDWDAPTKSSGTGYSAQRIDWD